MKILLTLLLSTLWVSTSANQKFHEQDFIDPKIRALHDEGLECMEVVGQDCRHFFIEAIEVGREKQVPYMDFLYFQLGYYFDGRSQYDSSLYYTELAYSLTNSKDTNSAYRLILNSLGANYFRVGNYDKAMQYMLLGVQEEERINRPLPLAYAYNNLATVLGINENYEDAVRYYIKGYDLLKKANDATIIGGVAANAAIYLKKLNRFEEARKWALEALALAELHNNASAYCYANYILGTTEPNIEKSLSYIEKAIAKARTTDMRDVLADALDIYGMKLSEKGAHEQAILSVEEAIALHKASNYTTGLLTAYNNAATIYYQAEQYKRSSEYFQKFNALYESNISAENKKRISDLNKKYETEKKERLLAEQDVLIQKKNLQFRTWLLGGGSVLFGLIFVGLHYRNSQHRKLKFIEQENENAVLRAMMNGEEGERNRISKDLHDGVAAMLGATRMSLESLPFLSDEQRNAQLNKLTTLVGNTHTEVRRIAHDLLPVTLEREGLRSAVRQFVADLNTMGILEVRLVEHFEEDLKLPKRIELMLYRIIQELMNNVIRHAGATEAVIRLSAVKQELMIEVADNGVGFAGEEENQGLYSIKKRINTIGGTFNIAGSDQKGSTAKLTVRI